MSNNEALTKYIGAFVDELAQSGVHHVIVSPGSRSTPIAMLLAEHPDIEVKIHVDERSAAFFGLGIAKTSNRPVALLCTSGTAAANYFPAIVEAYYARVPLIVITADRPHELRDTGAAQTIDQVHLYGNHVKLFKDMPLPEDSQEMLKFVRTVCSRAVQTSVQAPFGPVHINFPLREPLVPNLEDPTKFESTNVPIAHMRPNKAVLSDDDFVALANNLPKNGIIICGPLDRFDSSFCEEVTKLSNQLNYPILADPLSQLRSGSHEKKYIIDSYNAFLKNENARAFLKPEIILRFGSTPVSKSLMFYLKEHANVPQYVIDGGQGWRDPVSTAYEMIYCDETLFCERLIKLTEGRENTDTDWCSNWLELNQIVKNCIPQINQEDLNEGKLVYHLGELLPDHACIVVGNSMPIRDMDAFFHTHHGKRKIVANRGVNGIDGLVSTALGASLIEQNTYLIIGDLSFYHDMNGLLLAKLHQLNLNVILINNNGGGIFSMLSQANYPTHFELLFGTPTDLEFEHAAKMFGGQYYKVEKWNQYIKAMNVVKEQDGLNIIEIFTNRYENAETRQNLWNHVSQEINDWLGNMNHEN